MSERVTIIDNNTWNFTHIGTVGKILASDEEQAYKMCKELDVDYVVVNFGGYSGMKNDDWSKFLWFIRIASDAYPNMNEQDYYLNGNFGLAEGYISEKLANTILFKMLFHRFGEI